MNIWLLLAVEILAFCVAFGWQLGGKNAVDTKMVCYPTFQSLKQFEVQILKIPSIKIKYVRSTGFFFEN